MKRNRSQKQRGIVLLVVLGLLAMFGLLAVAFIVLTSSARESAVAVSRIEQYADDPRETLHQGLLQVLRGTNNPASVIGPHSLLEDMYGNQSIIGQLTDVDNTLAGGTLLAIDYTFSDTIIPSNAGSWRTDNNAYARIGCVLTMFDGPAAGHSTLIVSIGRTSTSGGRFGPLHILPFKGNVPIPRPGDRFVINGQRFSGGGFGFNLTSRKFDAVDPRTNYSLALLPNHPLNRGMIETPKGDWMVDPRLVGPNEDYDAVDFQNPHLAAQIHDLLPDPNGSSIPIEMVYTIPSFHRPALINYWVNKDNWDEVRPYVMPYVMMRPLVQLHPDFAVNNPTFDPISNIYEPWWDGIPKDFDQDGIPDTDDPRGPRWDVDCDGDGITDSIWIDAGLPVRSTADGRLYKPLVAVLCVDMDGRLNLNAHGSWNHLGSVPSTRSVAAKVPQPQGSSGQHQFAGPQQQAILPRGQGYGPAEIDLRPILTHYNVAPNNANRSPDWYLRILLRGPSTPQADLAGRYGDVQRVLADNSITPRPGIPRFDDWLSGHKNFAMRYDYWRFLSDTAYTPDLYGTPHDLFGLGAIGLDVAGRPLYVNMGQPVAIDPSDPTVGLDDPYEIDLSLLSCRGLTSDSPSDNPFSPAELEAVLRPYDLDRNKLPNRLLELCGTILRNRRHALTTESWSIPCPTMAVPDSRAVAANPGSAGLKLRAMTISELLRMNRVNAAAWRDLIAPELLAGLKMNLNRPFGNGFDDNGDMTVDNPGEISETIAVGYPDPTTGPSMATLDHDNDGQADTPTSYTARQLYARHLYTLMYLMVDRDRMLQQLIANGNANVTEADVKRMLAQWAVNVVDFRDRDSIMTRFNYDIDLRNGWNPTDPNNTVFGCERPELLITETLAFHDRRTENLEDVGNGKWDPDPATSDDDFDSRYRPQGSLFIELFNPWSWVEPQTGELHGDPTDPNDKTAAVDLARVSQTGNSAVWRMLICNAEVGTDSPEFRDPDDLSATNQNRLDAADIERVVYFAPGATNQPGDGQVTFTPTDAPNIPIHPGRYAVIGPGSQGGTYLSLKPGPQPDDPPTNSARSINLPNNARPSLTRGNGDSPTLDSQTHPITVVRMDTSQPDGVRFSVSEPTNGYTRQDGSSYDASTEKITPDVETSPLDKQDATLWDVVKLDQTVTGFKIIHLQRLANPLVAWHATDNPYRTIDSMPIDLTCFNGASTAVSPDNPTPSNNTMFHSRQRGEQAEEDNLGSMLIWKQEALDKEVQNDTATTGQQDAFFTRKLKHSLGYLNYEYFGDPVGAQPAGYKGEPSQPFPWFTFNNRPFVSQMELMLVPAYSSSKLLTRRDQAEHRYFAFPKLGEEPHPYNPKGDEDTPYPHLLNFFRSDETSVQLHRILDFLYVPSRFVGTEEETDPSVMTGGEHWYHPPYHRIPRYREPGKININTIFQPEVWQGLANYFPYGITEQEQLGQVDPVTLQWRFWDKLVRSRQGNPNVVVGAQDRSTIQKSMLAINDNLPTRFARPFRSGTAGQLAPNITDTDGTNLRPDMEIESTLLRPARPDPSNPGERALFEYQSGRPVDDTDRNPYFRYQGIQRLGNLVTTRSNVYAVWITVGYFEVTQLQGNYNWREYPDGYKLGAELGLDTGDINRHRAFYLIDRSIPVGFRRGEDLNVEDAILLRRFIE